MRHAKILSLLFICLTMASARGRLNGYCEDGGQKVVMLGNNSTTNVQKSYPGCRINVYLTGTTSLASIYSDNGGTIKANPFTADISTGAWFFYANNGTYDVKMDNAGIPSPFTKGAITIIDPYIIGGTVYADTLEGSDGCAKIRAAITLLPAVGGVVDARGLTGTQLCSADPFNGTAKGPTILLGSSTWITDVSWIMTNRSHLFGVTRGNPGDFGTTIQASNSFPQDFITPIIEQCTSLCFSTQIENLTLDCRVEPTCIGVRNLWSEEQSYARKVLVRRSQIACFVIGGMPGDTPTYQAQNSGPYSDLECNSEEAGITTTVCVYLYYIPAFRGLDGLTCNGDLYNSKPTSHIIAQGASTTLINIHLEHATNGIYLGSAVAGAADMIILNIEAGPDLTNAIYIKAAPQTQQNIFISGVENSTMGGTTILDACNGNTINNTVGSGTYFTGVGVCGAQTVISTRDDTPSRLQNSLTLQKTLTIPGTQNSDSAIKLNFGGTYRIKWHDSMVSGEAGPIIATGNLANGRECLIVQNTDVSTEGAISGGTCINGNGYNNQPGWGGIGAGYTGDMGTLTARAAAAAGVQIKDGVIDFLQDTSLTPGSTFTPTLRWRMTANGMLKGGGVPFASLNSGSPTNGTLTYCTDCTNASNPCVGAGTGAFAKRLNGAWDCR